MWLAGSELSLVTPRLDAFRSIMICRKMKKNIFLTVEPTLLFLPVLNRSDQPLSTFRVNW